MKKLLFGILLIFIACFSVVVLQKDSVLAEENICNVESVITVEQDTIYTNIDFVVNDSCSRDVVFNILSGTLTIDSCSIQAATSESDGFTCVFKVGEGASLVIKDTTINNIIYAKCIENYGVVEIDNVTFVNDRTSVENNGSYEVNSLKYYSGNLEKVTLNSGFISVYENTKVDKPIVVNVAKVNDMTVIVKGVGINVFASKYIDMFSYRNASSSYYFDYIGDFDTSSNEIKDASGKVSVRAGDIVLTTMNLAFKNDETLFYSPKYCSSYKYLKNEFDRVVDGDLSPIILYKSNGLGRTLNNYSANFSSAVFNAISNSGNVVTLNVNCITKGVEGRTFDSFQIDYLSGSNHAIFVDIPEGYEYDSVEFLKGGTETDVVGVLDDEVYGNNCYIRPIIEYKTTTYNQHTITANFIVKEKVVYANVDLESETDVTLNTSGSMVVGNSYVFTLSCEENKIISVIKFNGNSVDFEYDDANGVYLFEAQVLENNLISVETKTVLSITPNPNKVEFEYTESVELKETYKVSEEESIDIEYIASEKIKRGTYAITEIQSCSSDKYVIKVVGNTTYSIVQKKISVSDIEVKTYSVTYSETLTISEDNFLVDELPYYLDANLDDYRNFVAGEQFIRLKFSILNENYTIVGDEYVLVKLVILPKSVDTSGIVFEDILVEYTGLKITVQASNYDEDIIEVAYTYYLAEDITPVDAINVGVYTVKAVFSAKADVYAVNEEKTISLTITPKAIDMTDYFQSIETTVYEYDGTEKSLNLKEDTLPDGVIISGLDTQEVYVNSGIYYYWVYFDTTSDNYSCVSEKRVALIINAIIVTIEFETTEFNYTGKTPNLVVKFTNVLNGDVVAPVFENAVSAEVGTHTIRVLRLDNTNYALAGVVDLEYTIVSVSVDMSGIKFENIEAVYDGNSHRPELTGVLPLEISYEIDTTSACINSGMYTIKCTFTSSDAGIVAPQPIYATVTIHKRELTAIFSEPSNMIANGQRKNLIVELEGVVSGEEVRYSLEYSNEPILAGEYTCRVNLIDNDNYTLKSNSPYRFIIFMSTINYSDADLNMSVTGKFSSRENLTVSKINDNLVVVNLLSKMDIKNYLALNISCVSFSSELMTVSVDSRDLADKVNYLKAYRIKDNQLQEIEFTMVDNIISFKSNCNEKIIFIESHDYIYSHRLEINAIIIFAIVSMLFMVVLEVINVRNKKKTKIAKQVK